MNLTNYELLLRRLALLAALAPGGCDFVSTWEYQTTVPAGTTPRELAAIEADLRSNGYRRVRTFNRTNGWTDEPVAIAIYATKTERKRHGVRD